MTRPTPQELGFPTLEEAYRAAVMQRWRAHPAIWHTVTAIGPYEFRHLSQTQAWQRFAQMYQKLLDWVAEQLNDDPDFCLQLPDKQTQQLVQDKPKRITTPGDARAHLAVIRKHLRQQRQDSNLKQ